ncbi:MAG TPA: Crp/Fnr family transcriptional regulator [Candidatus Oscillibacter excrementigallinarum]|uniref:Crp/Fnr family transcriptional regulator n=1 Tax=Candidatus Oscillibacter excrementigallinarum TaxID=2838716 RepID=A0A9D2RRC2_9FIRM|nr:Crp/Fnr family transcriptional regulator [Candidatus Oscillibacter excrementigallinarum]
MEVSAILLHTALFQGISQQEFPALLTQLNARRRQYDKGAVILHRGDQTARLGLVLSGTVHMVKEDFWGARTIVGLARPGEVFAESYACLPGAVLEVSVLAAADTEILFLDAAPALDGGAGGAQFSRNLLAMLAGRNLTLTRKIGHMARRSIRDKLLSYLSAQAMQAGGPEFDIPLDRQQLADYLAVDRSALSAALGKLRDEGVLTFRKNHFCLLQKLEHTD